MNQAQATIKEVGGVSYSFYKLDPDRALDTFIDLQTLLLPAAGNLSAVFAEDVNTTVAGITAALTALSGSASDKALVKRLVTTMMTVTHAEGDGQLGGTTYKLHFTGKFWEMMTVVAYGCYVNFGNFTGPIRDTLSSVIAKVEALGAQIGQDPSNSPPAADGTSGD